MFLKKADQSAGLRVVPCERGLEGWLNYYEIVVSNSDTFKISYSKLIWF